MRRAARIDNTARDLRAYAESLGFFVLPINGVIDCVLFYGSHTCAVDWKSPEGGLTDAQGKAVARGAPIRFISKPEQLDQLRHELMGKKG